MRARQGVAEIERDVQHALNRQFALLFQHVIQRPAADIFHHDVVLVIFFDGRQHLNDVGVVQFLKRLSLASEALQQVRVMFDDLGL